MAAPNATRTGRFVATSSNDAQQLAQTFPLRIEHSAALDIESSPLKIRQTCIICTIGPKTNSPEKMVELRKAGMGIVRMNFSHGDHQYHGSVIDNVRKSEELWKGTPVAIALDTKGPEIRTGMIKDDGEVFLSAGDEFILTTDEAEYENGSKDQVYVDYKNLPNLIKPGNLIYMDDGLISLEVKAVSETAVTTVVQNSGKLSSRKGCNLPDTDVDLPALSEKDKNDLRFGVEKGVNMVFASFIRKASDVLAVRKELGDAGKHIAIISKIENREGVRNFHEILEVTDGVMVARGDLGIEIPAEKVFLAQKMMITRCNIVGKPVICATQMLESMTVNPRPTRAEASDVANAVLDGADCVMLSGETAKGAHPLKAVEMMQKICLEAEAAIYYGSLFNQLRAVNPTLSGRNENVAVAAVIASQVPDCAGIIVLTRSGETARLVAKYRPKCPILVITRNGHAARVVRLYRGCHPVLFDQPVVDDWQADVDRRIEFAIAEGRANQFIGPGNTVVAIQGWMSGSGFSNTMRVLMIGEDGIKGL